MKMKSIIPWIRLVWIVSACSFLLWQWSSYQAKGIDKTLLENNTTILVEESPSRISFISDSLSALEVLFFPGGLVDPKAYVPLARGIAEANYNVHIIKMPWRMSTKGYQNIKELFNLNNENKTFVLGGHSQGAKMAAQFVYENRGLIDGLFLLGTSHPRDIDLSMVEIPTLKIYAEKDGLASVEEVLQNQNKLPANSELALLEGGNHAQFGSMGQLLMDNKATISREEQHEKTIALLLKFLIRLSENLPKENEND